MIKKIPTVRSLSTIGNSPLSFLSKIMTYSAATWRARRRLQLFPAVKIWHGYNNTKSVSRRGFMWNFVGDRCRAPIALCGRSMCVWRASLAALEKPRSVRERPKYEQRRITLLTLWATPDKRYDAKRVSWLTLAVKRVPRPASEQLIARQILQISRPLEYVAPVFLTCVLSCIADYVTLLRVQRNRGYLFEYIYSYPFLMHENLEICTLRNLSFHFQLMRKTCDFVSYIW